MSKTYKVLDVARYIIERCNSKGYDISNLKLQKILYFVQAEFLVVNNKPCFEEDIEAWGFGPVVSVVYHMYKGYGGGNIPVISDARGYLLIDESDRELIDGIIDECSEYTASQLVEITHSQKPWKDVYTAGMNCTITNESIKTFFEEG